MATRTFAWQCRYCGELKKTEKIALRHEKTCLMNPDAKNCVRCIHIVKYDTESICDARKVRCTKAVSADCKDFERK